MEQSAKGIKLERLEARRLEGEGIGPAQLIPRNIRH